MVTRAIPASPVSAETYALVLLLTFVAPLLAPFSARVIAQRQRVVDVLLTITLFTLPISLVVVVCLYAWSLLLEIIGLEEGKNFCRAIDGRDEGQRYFRS